jgi:hypothetical protein
MYHTSSEAGEVLPFHRVMAQIPELLETGSSLVRWSWFLEQKVAPAATPKVRKLSQRFARSLSARTADQEYDRSS